MENLLRSFSFVDRKIITKAYSRAIESDLESDETHEAIENPEHWNPPALHATDVYKVPLSYAF